MVAVVTAEAGIGMFAVVAVAVVVYAYASVRNLRRQGFFTGRGEGGATP